jgi:hypothetical protein
MVTIINRDKPLTNNRDGATRSTIDGKMYDSRSKWDEHLKKSGCRQIEKGEGEKPRELAGDFNCRKALTEATHEVLRKK